MGLDITGQTQGSINVEPTYSLSGACKVFAVIQVPEKINKSAWRLRLNEIKLILFQK